MDAAVFGVDGHLVVFAVVHLTAVVEAAAHMTTATNMVTTTTTMIMITNGPGTEMESAEITANVHEVVAGADHHAPEVSQAFFVCIVCNRVTYCT